ncbi:acetolactate synthase small subunit [Crassaminicella indica]|uniref:Acetolactate synthase small subunit n=1 Tax=Crassaminicella indica TaxID=2855394 RepID=A0ABX8R9B7_9CLOT|nr:acetolactate synthase small subunit [Crassaminicella indica]QXM05396.1 acetolactate synthase small subunit [Crassaminicella indica]
MNRVLFAEVNNQPEVLMRILGLLRRREFHIKSISMVEAENPTLAHLMITTKEEVKSIERVMRSMEKIIDVYNVKAVDENMKKELSLYKVM